jgi:hypothetical protein
MYRFAESNARTTAPTATRGSTISERCAREPPIHKPPRTLAPAPPDGPLGTRATLYESSNTELRRLRTLVAARNSAASMSASACSQRTL